MVSAAEPLRRPVTIRMSGIAELAGVGRTAVSNWRQRFPDFPAAVGATTNGDLFDLRDVEAWLIKHGKITARVSTQQWLWKALDAARGVDMPERLVEISAAFLTYLHLAHTTSARTEGEDLGLDPHRLSSLSPQALPQHAIEAAAYLERVYPHLHNVLVPSLQQLRPHHADLLLTLVGLTSEVGVAEVFEALLERRHRWLGRSVGEYWTARAIVQLVVQLASPYKGYILDPVAGEGGFLLAAAEASGDSAEIMLAGQEINESTWRLAMQRLVVNDIRADLRLGDSLHRDGFAGMLADWVLCDPPYGLRDWQADRLGADSRWQFGLPTATADFAWIQHTIAHLREEGRGLVLLPAGTLYRGGPDGRIRAELLRRGAVEAIIALPRGFAPSSVPALALWVVRRPGSAGSGRPILLVDGAGSSSTGEEGSAVTEQIDRIVSVWRTWIKAPDTFTPVTGLATVVPVLDLLAADAAVIPARWISAPQQQSESLLQGLQRAREVLTTAQSELSAGEDIPLQVEASQSSEQQWRVGDLIAKNVVSLRTGTRIRAEDLQPDGIPVIGAAEVRARGAMRKPRFVDPDQLTPRPELTQAGDIVVLTEGNQGIVAMVDERGGHLIAYPCQGLRPHQDWLDPYVVAAFLQSQTNAMLSGGTVIRRARLHDLTLPRLTVQEQASLSESLQALARKRRLAVEMTEAVDHLTQQLVDGLATGALRVPPQPASTDGGPP
jgi:type I restriction-modification system DNA methylase subunit